MIIDTTLTSSQAQDLTAAIGPLKYFNDLANPNTPDETFKTLAQTAWNRMNPVLSKTDIPEQIQAFIQNPHIISGLRFRNLPTPKQPITAPKAIREPIPLSIAHILLAGFLKPFNQPVANKRFESSIRFQNGNMTNEETWHGHPQFHYTAFYCHQGDLHAQTNVFSANMAMRCLQRGTQTTLLTPFAYTSDQKPFALIAPREQGFRFTPELQTAQSNWMDKIESLDLPNLLKFLDMLYDSNIPRKNKAAIHQLQNIFNNWVFPIIHHAGDLILFNEKTTIRYSAPYKPSTSNTPRWMQTLSLT